MLRKPGSHIALGALVAWLGSAQVPLPKEIDIGAREAPLSEAERTELAQAIASHNYAAEKAVIDRAIAEHPRSWELRVLGGRVAYLEKHPMAAVEALERADSLKPLSEDDRLTLALADEFSGRPVQARAELKKLTDAAPKNARYWYLLGRFNSLDQHLEEAISNFTEAVKLDPNLLRAYEEMGRASESLGLVESARSTYETGAARNRLQRIPWEWSPLDLGVLLLKNGDLDQAEKLFLESLRYNPRFGWAHYYLAQLLQQKGRNAESIAEYRAAVVNDPNLQQAWLALGREYTRVGDKDQAAKCLAIFRQLEEKENSIKARK